MQSHFFVILWLKKLFTYRRLYYWRGNNLLHKSKKVVYFFWFKSKKVMLFFRTITDSIHHALFTNKAVILYWPRQVGKTTLAKEVLSKYSDTRYITWDDPIVREQLTNASLQQLQTLFKWYRLVVIDEAQRITNIWITLKLIVDHMPELQVIATWSSSFDLANTIHEPLTWRIYTFRLFPFSREEITTVYDRIQRQSLLEQVLIYGSYPEVMTKHHSFLSVIVESYLYKDLLMHQTIKKSDTLMKLLKALALQIGSEVSYNELAQIVWLDPTTVEKYIQLLEQSFVIFRLWSLSRNIRNELKKSKKIYFRDLGVRNTLINNLNPLSLRNDTGALRENFFIAERQKYLLAHGIRKECTFWRTKQQQEIDYIEEANGIFDVYECKRSDKKKRKIPSNFAQTYSHQAHLITPTTFEGYLCP